MAQLTFKAMDTSGQPLPKVFLETLYLSSLGSEPFKTNLISVEDGRISLITPSEPFQAVMVMPVDGFGVVNVYADNNGQGFGGKEKEINLEFEAARARVFKVRKWIEDQDRNGYIASLRVQERLDTAGKYLQKADRAEPGSKSRTVAANKSLKESLWAGEMAVLEKAKRDIAKRGQRDGFLFGCNCFGHPGLGLKYDELFLQLFNYATVPFYWASFEPRQGEKGYNRTDEMVSWLKRHKVTAKGHPLVYFHKACIPEWTRSIDYLTMKSLHRERIYEIVDHYRGRIDIFDVINEAHDIANELGYTQEQLLEMTKLACDATHEANPEAIRIINNCCTWGEYATTDVTYFGKSPRPRTTPYRYLKDCLEKSVDFEVIGLQLYYPAQDMFEIGLQLDRFSRLGKPIHVTELGVSSENVPDPTAMIKEVSHYYWHGPWSEEAQTDWIEQFYTLCYSKSYINAITWWDFADVGHFFPHGGFLRSNLTPKKSYYVLKNLIEKWSLL